MSEIEEIVHVVPLGHEFDRVVRPFDKLKANRVYLLTILKEVDIPYDVMEEMAKKQMYFVKLEKMFSRKGV